MRHYGYVLENDADNLEKDIIVGRICQENIVKAGHEEDGYRSGSLEWSCD